MKPSRIAPMIAGALVLLFYYHPGPLLAAETPVLTWPDVQRAAQNHPALKVALFDLDASEAATRAARQYPNPELELSGGQSQGRDSNETAFIWGVELGIPLLSPGVYRNEKKAARSGYARAQAHAEATRLETFQQLRELFLRIAADEQRVRVLEQADVQLEKLVEIAAVRVEKGEARTIERLRLEMELEKNRALLMAERDLAAARKETLILWLGLDLPADYLVEAQLAQFPPLAPESEALGRALERHPAIAVAQASEQQATDELNAQRHRRLPDLGVGGFVERELDATNYGAALSFSVPIWNWNSGAVSEARAEQNAARQRSELARRELTAAVHRAHARARGTLNLARSYIELIMPKANANTTALEQMYRIGEVSLIELLDARRSGIETKTEMIEATLDYHLAHLELMGLMGGNLDEVS